MPIKFSPIKFPLKMRGVDVRNLEDLRKYFDLNATVAYFKDGKLLKWLEARYYDDEADKISSLDENAPDFREKLCSALGVTCDEKSSRNDGGIVYEMFQWDEDGNIISPFNATANTDGTDAEKEYQPVNQNKSAVDNELREIFATIFGKRDIWEVVDRDGLTVVGTKSEYELETERSFKALYGDDYKKAIQNVFGRDFDVDEKTLTPTQKKMFLKMVCDGKYSEEDLIFIRVVEDFSSGFAFTKDSFCIGGDLYDYQLTSSKFRTVFYKEIISVELGGYSSDWAKKEIPTLRIYFKDDSSYNNKADIFFNFDNVRNKYTTQIITKKILWQIGKFLDFAKG